MKSHRLQYRYRANASKLHKTVGDLLRTSPYFMGHRVYQEYPVSRINRQYDDTSHHVDWAVLDLHLVVECHGVQHEQPATFGGITAEEAALRFQEQQERDVAKRRAILDAGWTYIVVWYYEQDQVTDQLLLERYLANLNPEPLQVAALPTTTPYQERQRDRARELRQERYQAQKEKARLYRATQRQRAKERLHARPDR